MLTLFRRRSRSCRDPDSCGTAFRLPQSTLLFALVFCGAVLAAPDLRATVPNQPSLVTISGRQLLVQRRNPDGSLAPAAPYVIRGVNWSPASTTTSSGDPSVRRPQFGQWHSTDIPLFDAMNVNTVRFFIDPGLPGDPSITVPGLTILDELYENGIMAIMTVDDGNNTVSRMQPVVDHYKNHPAILLWSLGSEWNINRFFKPEEFPTVDSAAAAIESAAQVVKSRDTVHPVTSSYGSIVNRPNEIEKYVTTTCPSIDVWSLNEYRGPGFSRLFDQWRFITTKPMFLGEYGIDAYNSTTLQEDQATHSQWVGWLWDDIARNLSANDPDLAALGGMIFEWNDEWWKAGNPSQHDTGGWFPIAFPDGAASEEWWGIVNIQRQTRQLYGAMTTKFAPGYITPSLVRAVTYRAVSHQPLLARFWENGALLYQGEGATASDGGGRGFNIATINPATGRLRDPIQRFDTWATRNSGTAMNAMVSYLDGLPNGTIVLIAVGDEAGLNQFPPSQCSFLPYAWVVAAMNRFATLGSTQIQNYCYGDQWAMISIKGNGALSESHSAGADASTQIRIHDPWTDDPLVSGSSLVRTAHVAELRTRIDLIRIARGLAAYAWSDSVLTPLSTKVRAQHVIDLRTALNQAYVSAGLTPPTYTDPVVSIGMTIRGVHVSELRSAVIAIE